MRFDGIWSELVARLRPGLLIPNWTRDKGHFGEDFRVVMAEPGGVVVAPPGGPSTRKRSGEPSSSGSSCSGPGTSPERSEGWTSGT